MTLTIVNAISAIARRIIKISGRWSPEFSRLLYAIANKNCVHNCEEHNFTWFHIRSSIYSPTSIKRPPSGLWKVAGTLKSGRLIQVGRLIEVQYKLGKKDSKHDFIDSI